MKNKEMIVTFLPYILFVLGILVYTFTTNLIKGNLFPLYSDNDELYEEYVSFWKNMTSEQRLVLSQTYFKFFTYFEKKIDEIQKNIKNKNIEFDKKTSYSDFITETMKFTLLPFVRVSLIPKSANYTRRLLIASHFDGHNLTKGGTAYDDAIHVVSMLRTIDILTKGDYQLNTRVDFLFDGGEELGLIGAYQYVDNLTETIDYDYLNLESMGGSQPYVFVIKSVNGNYRVQNALSKTRGTILLPTNYILSSIGSTTDHFVFDKQNWKGGVNVFLGKGSVYHTKYDRIEEGNEYHLKVAGNQLLDFILNYEAEGYNGNSVGYGIAPISVVFPMLVMYILIPIVFIVSVVLIIIKERKEIKVFLKDLLKSFICFIIILIFFLLEGLLIYLINSNAASANQVFLGLTALSGFFLFLFLQRIFKIKKWSRFRLIIDALLMIVLITTDLSLPLCCLTILSTVIYFFDNKIIKFIFAFLQYWAMSLLLAVLIQVFMQFTTRMEGITGNLFVFSLFFIFCYHMSVSPLEFNEITEENDISGELKNLFSQSKEENHIVNNDLDDNVNEALNDLSNNLIGNKTHNKIFNKKKIKVYLLILYIAYPIILLIILFLKSYPFSKDYILYGSFFNVFKENSTSSSMIFFPFYEYNYAEKNIKNSETFKDNIKEINMSQIVNIYPKKVFVYESHDNNIGIFNDRCRNIQMPNYNFIDIIPLQSNSNETHDFKFEINITNNTCLDYVQLYINCSDCVKKVNNKTIQKNDYIFLKVGKENITNDDLPDFIIDVNVTLTTQDFNYTVFLNTLQITKDYYQFLDAFGEATCNTFSHRPGDTLFVYERSYKS